MEKEILNEVNLCNSKGYLDENAIGWCRKPLVKCNLAGHFLRKKKWNYWLITNADCLFSATISNIDYLGVVFIYFYNYKTGEFSEKTVIIPFGMNCTLPEGINDNTHFKNKTILVNFKKEEDNTRLYIDCNNLGESSIRAELLIYREENQQSINVVIPWSKRKFQFTSKQNCLPTEGRIIYNGEIFQLSKDNSFGSLDFGRGVWPYNTMWNWATFSGKYDDRTIGIYLGANWTDGTGMTENGFIIDGVVYKINENITFNYSKEDIMKPWTLKTESSNKINIIFTPTYKRIAKTNIIIIKSTVYQIIGDFSGELITDTGEKIHFENIKGCAEEHFARW